MYEKGPNTSTLFGSVGGNNGFNRIYFNKGITPIQPICYEYENRSEVCIVVVENEGKTQLWSRGKSDSGILGQGLGKTDAQFFAPLDYDMQNVVFREVKIDFGNTCFAVTDKGELYGWGNNENGKLGMSNKAKFFSPTEIPFFKDYYIHEFSVSNTHSLILASPRGNSDTKMLFHIGRVIGLINMNTDENNITHLTQFDNLNISYIEAGFATSFISLAQDHNKYGAKCVHHEYT